MAPAALLIACIVVPLWIAAGLADWACHRSSGIECTSGLPENLVHWFLFLQMGVAVAAAALLQVNTGVVALVLAAFVVHEFTVWLELRYTVPRRNVRPVEQVVHSFQELLALTMALLLAVVAWDDVQALWGPGTADWSLRWKEQPLPAGALAAGAAAAALFNALPLLQETRSCLRARRAGA